MTELNLKFLCDETVKIAREAGEIVMEYYHNGAKEMIKSDGSDVTEADLASDAFITQKLKELTPNIPVATEEGVEAGIKTDISKGTYWLVDPLDGTKEFISGTGNFAVLIALIVDNKSVLGTARIPAQNIDIFGAKGTGSFISHDGEASPLARGTRNISEVIQRRYNGLGEYEGYDELKSKFPFKSDYCNPAFYCLPLIEDKADVFIFSKKAAKEWAIAPWDAILREVGGMVCNIDGSECVYNNPSVNTYAFISLRNNDFRKFLLPPKSKPSNSYKI